MSNKFAAIATTFDGEQVLRYFEPDGDDQIIHNIVTIDGIFVDAKISGFSSMTDEKIEELRATMIDRFDQESADRAYQMALGMIG